MAERAIFLDRDNTIIDNDGYLGDPTQVRLLQGAAAALAQLRRLGYRIIVVSNQSGVARGMFSEADVEAVNQEMCRQLREQAGAHIDASYYCPYHPEAKLEEYRMDHDWRKPKPGMLKQAAEDFNLDLAQCWMVGDQPRDIASGAAAGCRTVLLRDPQHPDSDPAASATVSPNFIVKTLADAARVIARESRSANPDPVPLPLPAAAESPAAPLSAEPTAPESAKGAPMDEKLITRLTETLARSGASSRTDKLLEELVLQLRTNQRHQDAPPEYSPPLLAGAALLQLLTLLLLLLGLSRGAQADGMKESVAQIVVAIRAQQWLLTAAVLQGLTILLFLIGRRK